MTTTRDGAVDGYLQRLEHALRDLPPQRRQEIVSEIEEHLSEALAELGPDASEAAVRNALDRVGDPDEIAVEARERFGVTPPRATWTDPVALVLLLVGGFLFLFGWIAGVVLLWLSDVWSTRDKILGTLLVPGGLLTPFLFGSLSVTSGSSSSGPGGLTTEQVSDGVGSNVLMLIFVMFLVVAPIVMAVVLGRKLRRARAAM